MSIHHQLKDHEGNCKVLSWSNSLHKVACGLVLYAFVVHCLTLLFIRLYTNSMYKTGIPATINKGLKNPF